jgi:23S rRNA (adenine2030-N6)-methyltransferase
MLSYRHAFHAGNHADVLKHLVLVQALDYLASKDKPFWYIDTHAGAGRYELDAPAALKTAEFRGGIGRLWAGATPAKVQLPAAWPAAIERYLEQVRALNPDGRLLHYPGSPQIARQLLRAQDRLRLFELHSSDLKLLDGWLGASDKRCTVTAGDGLAALKALLPPPPRRALVLIDPSYEVKDDYRQVATALGDALHRFASGVYLVWYPLLARADAARLPAALRRQVSGDWLDVTLSVRGPAADGLGMHGSGMFVANPPWTLPEALRAAMPVLVKLLGEDAQAGFTLQHKIA